MEMHVFPESVELEWDFRLEGMDSGMAIEILHSTGGGGGGKASRILDAGRVCTRVRLPNFLI